MGWYEWQRDGLGERFLESVGTALESLSTAGSHGAHIPGIPERYRVRRLHLRGFPYFIIFRELEDEVQVVAVAHERRRPSYWRRRLDRSI